MTRYTTHRGRFRYVHRSDLSSDARKGRLLMAPVAVGGRPIGFDRDAMLDRLQTLFWTHGCYACRNPASTTRSGRRRRSFDAVAALYLTRVDALHRRADTLDELIQSAARPTGCLMATFDQQFRCRPPPEVAPRRMSPRSRLPRDLRRGRAPRLPPKRRHAEVQARGTGPQGRDGRGG